MLEVLRALPDGKVQELHLVYFEGASSDELLPEFSGKIVHHKVPCKWINPFLLKAIFFQVWSFFFSRFFLEKDILKIGIGTCSLNVDLVNIQFIQEQWKPFYLNRLSLLSPKTWYKHVLFFYFSLCENFLYRNPKIKFMVLSQFVSEYLTDKFGVEDLQKKVIYSSTNLDHFPGPTSSKESLLEELSEKYPQLKNLQMEKTIFLFVGAFERKGLPAALSRLSEVDHSQIIVIGKPEKGTDFVFPPNPKVIYIPYTKEISKFYELSDCFIFPSIYEPFGLVVTEAAAMGNIVLVPRKNVGASEILEGLSSVYFLESYNRDLSLIKPLTIEDKKQNSIEVAKRLSSHSWTDAAKKFEQFISSF